MKRIGEGRIDALVFNAGISLPEGQVTGDGFETTFAVNHLADYTLLRSSMLKLARGARIILTTSVTYDPAEKTIIPPPLHADAPIPALRPLRAPHRPRAVEPHSPGRSCRGALEG
jgi:hypothetical protein